MVVRWNHNPCVGGSIPSSATTFKATVSVAFVLDLQCVIRSGGTL